MILYINLNYCFRLHKNNTVTKRDLMVSYKKSSFRLHKNNTVTKLIHYLNFLFHCFRLHKNNTVTKLWFKWYLYQLWF